MIPQEIIPRYTGYIPSIYEIMAGAGVIAYGVLGFTIGVRYLNLVNHEQTAHEPEIVADKQPVVAAGATD